jgi:hypothetical protein
MLGDQGPSSGPAGGGWHVVGRGREADALPPNTMHMAYLHSCLVALLLENTAARDTDYAASADRQMAVGLITGPFSVLQVIAQTSVYHGTVGGCWLALVGSWDGGAKQDLLRLSYSLPRGHCSMVAVRSAHRM